MGDIQGVRIHPCSLHTAEQSLRVAMRLASAPAHACVRLVGGAGYMGGEDAQGFPPMILQAFAGFRGTVIGGGTQMRMRDTPRVAVMGFTEALPLIKSVAPQAVIIGVVPRLSDLIMIDGVGLMISDGASPGKPPDPYITIMHPALDVCLLLQYSADIPLKSWADEWKTSLDYMGKLRTDALPPFRTAHVFYNGGSETQNELLALTRLPHEPDNPWLIFLVSDSGRITQQYAQDRDFCREFGDRLVVCTKTEFPERFIQWIASQKVVS